MGTSDKSLWRPNLEILIVGFYLSSVMAKTDADKMMAGKQLPGVFIVVVLSVTAEGGRVQSQYVATAAACCSPWQQMMHSPGCLSLLRSCTLIFHCKHTKNTCEHNPSILLWQSIHNSSASHHMIQILIPALQDVSPKNDCGCRASGSKIRINKLLCLINIIASSPWRDGP